jgi:hypothetical protein
MKDGKIELMDKRLPPHDLKETADRVIDSLLDDPSAKAKLFAAFKQEASQMINQKVETTVAMRMPPELTKCEKNSCFGAYGPDVQDQCDCDGKNDMEKCFKIFRKYEDKKTWRYYAISMAHFVMDENLINQIPPCARLSNSARLAVAMKLVKT